MHERDRIGLVRESRVLVPRVYGRVLRLSPAAILLALLVGGRLLGIVGALLASYPGDRLGRSDSSLYYKHGVDARSAAAAAEATG